MFIIKGTFWKEFHAGSLYKGVSYVREPTNRLYPRKSPEQAGTQEQRWILEGDNWEQYYPCQNKHLLAHSQKKLISLLLNAFFENR